MTGGGTGGTTGGARPPGFDSSTEDLAALIAQPAGAPPGGADIGIHTGQILSWDRQTGQNTVRVLGVPLQDVPMLNLTEALTLTAGAVVLLLRFKTTFFILGRITLPGTDAFFSGAMPDTPAPFYPVNTDTALQNNTVGASWYPKLVAGYVVNHPRVEFGMRCQVAGAGATAACRVQWYPADTFPAGTDPPGGTQMAVLNGLGAPGVQIDGFDYQWPAGLLGALVYIAYEVQLSAGVSGTDWVSALPKYFIGKN